MNDNISKLIQYFFTKKINSITDEAGQTLKIIGMSKLVDRMLMIGSDLGLTALYLKSMLPNVQLDIVDYFEGNKKQFVEKIVAQSYFRKISLFNGNFKALSPQLDQYDLVYIHPIKDERIYCKDYLKILIDTNMLIPDSFVILYDPNAECQTFIAENFKDFISINNLLIAKY